MSSDISDPILTPAKLLGKINSKCIPDFAGKQVAKPTRKETLHQRLVKAWKENTAIVNSYWDIWQKEYLTALRESHRKVTPAKGSRREQVSVGTVVLIKQNLPRSVWKLGTIDELHFSKDGLVRSAIVRLSTGKKITRPINLLVPIEVGSNDEVGDNICRTTGQDQSGATVSKPSCDAKTARANRLSDETTTAAGGNCCHTDMQRPTTEAAGGNISHTDMQRPTTEAEGGNISHTDAQRLTKEDAGGNICHTATQRRRRSMTVSGGNIRHTDVQQGNEVTAPSNSLHQSVTPRNEDQDGGPGGSMCHTGIRPERATRACKAIAKEKVAKQLCRRN
jgi:hypothetical protein